MLKKSWTLINNKNVKDFFLDMARLARVAKVFNSKISDHSNLKVLTP